MNRLRRNPGATAGLAAVAALTLLTSACTITPWSGESTGTPVSTSNGGVPAGYYRVNPGDTLGRIANAFGQRPQDIAGWNQLPPNASVVPGQVLRVAPPPSFAPSGVQPSAPNGAPAAAGVAMPAPVVSNVTLAWPAYGPVLQKFVPGKSTGILIGGQIGEPVKAAAAGRVVYAGTGIEAYGPLVIIKHNDSVVTAYGHNSKLLVKEDDAVTQGQPIAEMGTDSRGVTGVQFEVRSGGKPVDPLPLLPR
jgi:lipoprotein NlpD